MEPTIRDGTVLLVDTSVQEFKDNGIYIVVDGGMVLVKRVNQSINGSVSLISENPLYPTKIIEPQQQDQL